MFFIALSFCMAPLPLIIWLIWLIISKPLTSWLTSF